MDATDDRRRTHGTPGPTSRERNADGDRTATGRVGVQLPRLSRARVPAGVLARDAERATSGRLGSGRRDRTVARHTRHIGNVTSSQTQSVIVLITGFFIPAGSSSVSPRV